MEKTKDPIGEKLRQIREGRDISVPELSLILDIPKDRIYKWEQGKASPQYLDRQKLESWINGTWNNFPIKNSSEEGKNRTENQGNPETIAEALSIIKQQNAFLQRLLESNLAELSRDVNNNSAAIRAEIRGYGKYQLLKQSDWDDQEFAKAMAVVDKIYGEELKVDDGQGNVRT